MQVICKITNQAADVCCSVCGQGFALYWERHNRMERTQALSEIAKTLRSHHRDKSGPEAHPQRGFLVPEGRAACGFRRLRHWACTPLGRFNASYDMGRISESAFRIDGLGTRARERPIRDTLILLRHVRLGELAKRYEPADR